MTRHEDDYLPCEDYLNQGEANNEGFVLFQNQKTTLYYFTVQNIKGKILFRSEGYPNHEVRQVGISSVMKNRLNPDNYAIIEKNNEFYVALFALENKKEIARSCVFKNRQEISTLYPNIFPNNFLKKYIIGAVLFMAGLLLPILYCLFSNSCTKIVTVQKYDTVFVTSPCPIYDKYIDSYSVNFDFAKSTIKQEYKKTLDACVAAAQKDTTMYLQIRGFTDNVGSYRYNVKLSEARAEAVRQYLISKDVRNKIILFEGLGKRYPMFPNDISGKPKNRQVIIQLFGLRKIANNQ